MGPARYLLKLLSGLLASRLHTCSSLRHRLVAKEFYRRPLPRHCVSFSSPEGRLIFQEALAAGHMDAYFTLAGQLCTQDEPSYCGLTTLVMVLNALEMDPGRVWKGPWRWYHESMFTDCLPPDVLTKGIVMDKFTELAHCSGLHVDLQRVDDSQNIGDFRRLVSEMTANVERGILVSCYDRRAIGQTGTGHFAPIGGYHPQRELVFLFDTARFKYPPHWVPLAHLWEGMGCVDKDTGRPRGYMLVTRGSKRQLLQASSPPSPQTTGPERSDLLLFGLSDTAQQALLSPLSQRDARGLGHRLRQVLNDWIDWLNQPIIEEDSAQSPLDVSSVVAMAVTVLVSSCVRHQPCAFFLTLQPIVYSGRSRSDLMTSRQEQQQRSQDLLASSVGRAVKARIFGAPIEQDEFVWMTGDSGPFHMPFVPGHFSSTPASTDDCPVNALADAGLRLSLFLTSFLYVFPYEQLFPSGSQSKVPARSANTPTPATRTLRQVLERCVAEDAAALTPDTRREIDLVRASFSLLLSTALDVSKQCCANGVHGSPIGFDRTDSM